jgi:O-antigen biosynthesis protein
MNSLEFTGERFIPGQGGAQISYEHLHRYLYAARWAKGKTVLDVASGAGYGAALLAPGARAVWAVELDRTAVRHARAQCPMKNVSFLQADARCLPLADGCADLVVALEILEHVEEQEQLVRELARVAAANGAVFISTPNRAAYSDARKYLNPYHVREFYRDEFLELLTRNFPYVGLLTQQVRSGSLICPGSRSERMEILTEPRPDLERAVAEPMYFLALCGHSELQESPGLSAYLDPSDLLFSEWEREAKRLDEEIEKLGTWGAELRQRVKEKDSSIDHFQNEVALRDRSIADLFEQLTRTRSEVGSRDQTIVQLQQDFEGRTKWVEELQGEIARRDGQLIDLNRIADERDREIHRLAAELGGIRRTFLYRVLSRTRLLPR